MAEKSLKVLFSGGGTLGPVVPLLAVWDDLSDRIPVPLEGIWVGTPDGPEREVVEQTKLRFVSFPAPKLRRYFSWKTFWLPFALFGAIVRAFRLLAHERPRVVISVGGYTSVPIHVAAWLLRITALVHQQDVCVGLTNKIIAPLASSITCAFEQSKKAFKRKAMVIGNPVRSDVLQGDVAIAHKRFDLEADIPVVLVLGGGTGAIQLNTLVWDHLPEITQFVQIIHSTGDGKGRTLEAKRYRQYPFINREDLAHAYAVADVVVARAGMGTLTEISALKKPSILVPMPNSHQEDNAKVFAESGAGLVLNATTKDRFVDMLRELITDRNAQQRMQEALPHALRTDAANRLSQMALYVLAKKRTAPKG